MITRRSLVRNGLVLGLGMLLPPGWVFGETTSKDEKSYVFRWHVPGAHKEEIEQTLKFKGQATQEKDTKGIVVWIFVGLVLLPDLAKAIYNLVQGMKKGGVRIDTRGGKFEIDTDKSLPVGMVAVASDAGTDLYERDDLSTSSELAGVLLKAK